MLGQKLGYDTIHQAKEEKDKDKPILANLSAQKFPYIYIYIYIYMSYKETHISS